MGSAQKETISGSLLKQKARDLELKQLAAFEPGGAVERVIQAHREWLLTTEQPSNLYLLKEKVEQMGKTMKLLEALLPEKKEGGA